MKLIQPAEISAKIMTLIDNAEEELIIISPYNKIIGWTKLINRIKKAQTRNVKISWYSRKNHVYPKNAEEVRSIGIEPVLVNDLHAKLYMNEKTAIFTSMNMSKVSDDSSIDIGYITENKEEYEEINNVYNTHLRNASKGINNLPNSNLGTAKIDISKTTLQPKIRSKHFYINQIHEHILFKYGNQSFSQFILKGTTDQLEILTYNDFKEYGYKLEFEPYDRAIKIKIYLPLSISPNIYQKNIDLNRHYSLSEMRELDYSEYEHHIKYYFDTGHIRLVNWNRHYLKELLHDLDIVIEMVFASV